MKKFLSLALALTMALTLAACGGKTDTPPADTNDGSTAGQTGGKLVVYSALNEDNTIAIADQFKKDTGIEIEYISLGGGDAVARVQAEMANPKADILVAALWTCMALWPPQVLLRHMTLPTMTAWMPALTIPIISGRAGTWAF